MKLIKQLLSLFLIWTSSTGFQSKNFITNNHVLHKTKLTLSRRDIISKTSSFLTYIHFDDKEHKMEEEPEKPTEIIIPNPSIVSTSQLNIRIVGEITEENCARLGDVIARISSGEYIPKEIDPISLLSCSDISTILTNNITTFSISQI